VRRSTSAIGLLLVFAGLTSCGHPQRHFVRRVSEQAVMQAFRERSGVEPNVAVSSSKIGFVLDGDFADPRALRRYQRLFGRFTVYIAGPGGTSTVRQMLAGTALDAHGIRWRRLRSQGRTVLSAVKRYAANVVLSWTPSPGADRALDERWNRLDGLLRSLATGT
jgi:hypothetical protein